MSTELNQIPVGNVNGYADARKKYETPLEVLCVSRSAEFLELASPLADELPMARLSIRNIINGHADPLYNIEPLPDLVLFFQGTCWNRELEEYSRRPVAARPPLVVVGKADDPEALRSALRAGACEFLDENASPGQLAIPLKSMLAEIVADRRERDGNLVALINAKGGSGASLLASNIAAEAAEVLGLKTALVDLDVQFGNPGQYLDATPQRGLLEALQMAGDLDRMALEGYMIHHKSGLHILSTEGQDRYQTDELAEHQLERLLDLLAESYQQIIVDLPRHIDPFIATLLERADHVVMVVQQDIATLRDATRLMHMLTVDLRLPRDRIEIVVNRFHAAGQITLKDIANTLSCERVTAIPNDFRMVSESLNRAAPLHEIARDKAITRALQKLSETLTGTTAQNRPGMLARLKSWF